jgi:hypothetical protein
MHSDRRPVVVCVALVVAAAALQAQAPASATLSGLARDVACAPAAPAGTAATGGQAAAPVTVVGGRDLRKSLFGTGDSVILGAGTAQGIRAGDEYFVRRLVEDRFAEPDGGRFPSTVHTAGTIQVVEVRDHAAVARVTYGCDGIVEGDYIELFQPVSLPASAVGATPDFSNPARLVLGAERRQIGGAGEFMLLDRGSNDGVQAGQVVTIFRQTAGGDGPVTAVGTGQVYLVGGRTATVRIESSVDAVYVGDLVALHR